MQELSEITTQNMFLLDNWRSLQFWISIFLTITGGLFSILAFREAKYAKKAAIKARISLSIRNIENELSNEITLLNSIKKDISYSEMRKIILDLTTKMTRIKEVIVQLQLIVNDDIIKIDQVIGSLNTTLSKVKPDFEDSSNNFQLFNAMSTYIVETSQLLSGIIGKIQAKNLLEDTNDK